MVLSNWCLLLADIHVGSVLVKSDTSAWSMSDRKCQTTSAFHVSVTSRDGPNADRFDALLSTGRPSPLRS